MLNNLRDTSTDVSYYKHCKDTKKLQKNKISTIFYERLRIVKLHFFAKANSRISDSYVIPLQIPCNSHFSQIIETDLHRLWYGFVTDLKGR